MMSKIVKCRVQVSRREFHTHIHLNLTKVKIISCKKKKKNLYDIILQE